MHMAVLEEPWMLAIYLNLDIIPLKIRNKLNLVCLRYYIIKLN
jgi:hypothetical protein